MKSANPPFQKVIHAAGLAAYVPALAAAVATGHAINDMLTQAGMGTAGSVLATLIAAGIGTAYAGFIHLLVKGVAPLAPEDRAPLRPAIAVGTALVLAGSAYPNVIITAGHQALLIADRAYIARLAETGDQLKRASRALGQIETIIVTDSAKLGQMSVLESSGGVSGAQASGALTDVIQARSEELKAAQQLLAGPKELVGDQMATFDLAIDRMRGALLDKSLSIEARRVLMQRHGDEARSAAITIGAATPSAAIQALSDKLSGPQMEPVWSKRADIRRQQEEGFGKVRDELKRMGKALGRQASDLASALKIEVPVYSPEPASILVLRHSAALTHIWALAFALDLLPVILFYIAAGLYDAQRRRLAEADRPADSGVLTATPAPLGPHPYPSATRGRLGHKPPPVGSNGASSDDIA